MSIPEYDKWVQEPTRDNLAGVVKALEPTINAEVQNYPGPKPMLRSRAKSLAVKAVKSYDPGRKAHLRSWVVTQMKPLSRYSQQLRPIQIPEMSTRQAAEVARTAAELKDQFGTEPSLSALADETGLSVKRIQHIRRQAQPIIPESAFSLSEETGASLPGTTPPNIVGSVKDMVYDSLTGRDKTIYDLKTGNHGKAALSNKEIARRLGVTPAMVSQRSRQIAEQIKTIYNRQAS